MPGPMREQDRMAQGQDMSFDVLKRLAAYVLKNYKGACLMVVAGILVSAVATLSATLFTKNLIDGYILPMVGMAVPNFAPLAQAITKLAAVLAAGVLCAYLYNRMMVTVSQGTLRRLRIQLFSNMESLPVKYFDTHPHGDIMSVYTNDVDTLRQVISQSFPQLVNSTITLAGAFVSMVALSLPLTLISVSMVGVMLSVTSRLSRLSMGYFVRQQKDLGAVNGYIEEMMEGQRVIKVFCHEEEALQRFRELNDRLQKSADHANRIANITMPVNANLGNISYVLCAAVGSLWPSAATPA